MHRTVSFFLLFNVISSLPAQHLSLKGPVEGFVYDAPTRSLRAVMGSLAAASLGPPLLGGQDFGSVAPYQDHAVAFQEGRCLIVTRLGSEQVTTAELPGEFAVPDGISWSGDGSVAAIYSRANGWMRIVRGLPSAPYLEPDLGLEHLPGSLTAVSVNFHGTDVAFGIAGEAPGVYRRVKGGGLVSILASSNPVALTYSEDGETLYVLDGATKQLSALNTVNQTFEAWPLDALAEPVAMITRLDPLRRQVIYVAGRGDRSIVGFDAESQEMIIHLPVAAQPTTLAPLGRDSFLLGPRQGNQDPLWSLLADGSPKVFFIPATPTSRLEEPGR